MTSIKWQAGIREFTYSDVTSDLKMFINGRRFFPKGGNWGFSEYNPPATVLRNMTPRRVSQRHDLNIILTGSARQAMRKFHACLRQVWNRGLAGLLACESADGPDPDDNEMFLDNARDYVSLIRKHPSIGIYCGRNEGYPPAVLNAGLIETVNTLHSLHRLYSKFG